MPNASTTRRRFLTGITGLGMTVGLAGCASTETGPLEPRVSESLLKNGGWSRIDRIDQTQSETVNVAGTRQRVRTRILADVYENDRAVENLAADFELDASEMQVPAEMFVASKAKIDPSFLRMAIGTDMVIKRVLEQADRMARQQLRNQGFVNVRIADKGSLDIKAAGEASHRVYRADYPYDGQEFMTEGRRVKLLPGKFTVEAQFALWPYEGLLVGGGGLYPGESGELDLRVRDRSLALDLGLEPRRYRKSIRNLIVSVT